ncbi:transposase [Dasania sp. GY-19]|uniref:Transposase n=1 Tax=Dasania phycosphaerae TaxID=2950436 RepID=A0A9J6RSE0_9GAMM|nr:transposase [Dasania phycosphaerae]MCZ0867282.1 transposase [Dasania phycosphaerae]
MTIEFKQRHMDMSNKKIQHLFTAFKNELKQTKQPLKNHKAIFAISHCRTSSMGASFYSCKNNHEAIEIFHSCRHRSCFLCAQRKRLEWIEKQKQRLFNTPHFHVIFTLPHEYLPLWRFNEKLFTSIIFKASQTTLLELLADKKYGGVTPGILMTLHTWGRKLNLHPHTHCLVSAGGLDADKHWKAIDKFLLPSGVIRKVYRGKVQSLIKAAFQSGEITLPADWHEGRFWSQYRSLYRKEWSVRIEERYEHGKGVVLYLARYCKGGPLHPEQIKSATSNRVELSYLDHRDKKTKRQHLKPMELIQRLLIHVPPKGIHTARYFGLYSAASKSKHIIARNIHGTLSGVGPSAGSRIADMLLYCKTCGGSASLSHQQWPMRQKGISINKNTRLGRFVGHVQQVDETDIAKGVYDDST